MIPAIALITATLLALILGLLLVRLAPSLAPELPQPLRCRDCFDPDELLVYNGSSGEPPDSPLRTSLRRASLLAAALRHTPDGPALRTQLLRTANTAARTRSTQHLDNLIIDTARHLRQTSLLDLIASELSP